MSTQSYLLNALLMVSDEQSALQWFELVFFASAVPFLTATFLIHRRIPGGYLGWFFLWNFAFMRTVGFILVKAAKSTDVFIAGTIISSASISPLFFATSGIMNEVAHWHKDISKLGGQAMRITIFLVAGAIAMIIAGSVTQIYAHGTPSYSRPLQIAGTTLLLAILLGLCAILGFLWRIPVSRLEKRLLIAVATVLPLLGLRTVYGLVGTAVDNSTWNYYRAPLAAQVVMQILPDCLIIIIYCIAGLVTRRLRGERVSSQDAEIAQHQVMQEETVSDIEVKYSC